MASIIEAIGKYRPRIELGSLVQMEELVDVIAGRTGLNESGVRYVLLELRDVIAFFTSRGEPVKLDGLGIFAPTVRIDGTLDVNHRADKFLKIRLNAPGGFRAAIRNRDNIGKTKDEMVAMWNEEHPDDPVEGC